MKSNIYKALVSVGKMKITAAFGKVNNVQFRSDRTPNISPQYGHNSQSLLPVR
jgi:hypothetical protein